MSSSCLVWFILYDSTAGRFTRADKVSVLSSADVADFRKAVATEALLSEKGICRFDLLIFENKAAFDKRDVDDGREDPLEEDLPISGLGATKKNALVVVVQKSGILSQSIAKSGVNEEGPNDARKERWMKLNEILETNARSNGDSTAYSYVSWKEVRSLFNPQGSVFGRRRVDQSILDFLLKYLSYASKCLGSMAIDKEAKLPHFIAPILICVCVLFNGEVEIAVGEELVGNVLKAHGRFDFMIKRGDKAVCVVEAKKDDFDQGMAQDLIGCEVAADVGQLNRVYGIVTNYLDWFFLCSSNENVKIEICTIDPALNDPKRHSVKKIVEKIYWMLSTESAQI